MTDEEKIELHKGNIRKLVDKLYTTSSVNAESNYTEELLKEIKLVRKEDLISLASEFDVFGKCVFHYRLPFEYRLDAEFSKATETIESERIAYWKEYKKKLLDMKKGPEEEYDKIILMACTLHVPIDVEDDENNVTDDFENGVGIDAKISDTEINNI